jgi:hypothetical protein
MRGKSKFNDRLKIKAILAADGKYTQIRPKTDPKE